MQQELILEALPPEQKKRVVFMTGRLNPPTAGHYKVISKMKEFIRKNKDLGLEATPVIVIVEGDKSSADKSKNPLTAEERITFLKSSGRANGVIFLTAKNAFIALGVIRDAGYEPIAIGAGSDRAKKYKEMLDKSFKTPDDKEIKHYIVPGLDRAEGAITTKSADKKLEVDKAINQIKNTDEIDDENVSGSLARRAVELGYLEEFTKIVGLEKKPALAKILYDKIEKSMNKDVV